MFFLKNKVLLRSTNVNVLVHPTLYRARGGVGVTP
eukprot:SAG31_NODE_29374_length_396_cov_0.909091_1_plen_34_part_10